MKTLIKIILIIIAILLGNKNLDAQNTQIESDIRIAERILEEIFKSPETSARYMLPGHRMVQGEYIPGIGVHFRVGSGQSGVIYVDRENRNSVSGSAVTKEWVEEKMLEYFNGYAAQLRSLPDNEQVRITYGSDTRGSRVVIIGQRRGDSDNSRPKVTAWASMADIKRYASGNLSDSQFRSRLSVNDLTEAEEKRDLNIFASVLEASMNSADTEHLRVRGKPVYEYLPGFGAHFNVNVSSGSLFHFGFLEDMAIELDNADFDDFDVHIDLGDIRIDSPGFEFHPDSMNITIQQFADSMRRFSAQIELDTAEIRRQAERARQQAEEMRQRIELKVAERDSVDLTGEAESLMNELRQTISDYGSTLSSLQDNELLVITVNWEGRNRSLPDRTRVQITKSDLLRGAEPDIEEIRRR